MKLVVPLRWVRHYGHLHGPLYLLALFNESATPGRQERLAVCCAGEWKVTQHVEPATWPATGRIASAISSVAAHQPPPKMATEYKNWQLHQTCQFSLSITAHKSDNRTAFGPKVLPSAAANKKYFRNGMTTSHKF